MGQCSDAMRARAEATKDFKTTTSRDQATIKLLKVMINSCSEMMQ